MCGDAVSTRASLRRRLGDADADSIAVHLDRVDGTLIDRFDESAQKIQIRPGRSFPRCDRDARTPLAALVVLRSRCILRLVFRAAVFRHPCSYLLAVLFARPRK